MDRTRIWQAIGEEDLAPFVGALAELARAPEGDDADRLASRRAELKRRQGEDWSSERFRLDSALALALFAIGDAPAVAALVAEQADPYGAPTVVGLWVLGEGTLIEPAANPWKLGAGLSLSEAIGRVWGSIAARAPDFVAALAERLVALALLDSPRGLELGYLLLRERDRYERAPELGELPKRPTRRRDVMDWARVADLDGFRGSAPLHPPPAAPDLPRGWLEVAAVHRHMGDGMWRLSAPDDTVTLSALYDDEELDEHVRDETGTATSECLVIFGYGDDRSDVVVRDELDDQGEPMVFGWEASTWSLGEEGESFWEWFDRVAPELIAKRADAP